MVDADDKREIDFEPTELESSLVPNFCARATFAPGESLRRKGHHYTNMYLVLQGEVEVLIDHLPDPIIVGAGSPVGEIGFLKGCSATATVVARTQTTSLVLDDATLWRIERETPQTAIVLLRALARTVEQRLDNDAAQAEQFEFKPDPRIEVYLCRNEDMLLKAQRMRYRVYCEELGRSSPYADHERQIIRDNLDDFGHTFLALDGSMPVGTLRANFASEGPLGNLEDIYGMTASPNHPARTMICTKFIVDKAKRGGGAAVQLVAAAANYATKAGVRDCYIDCIPSLLPLYKRLGFEIAGERFFHYENGPSVPMVMDVKKHAERLARRAER